MNLSKLDYGKRKALEVFDAWRDVTGIVERNCGYYDELTGIVEEAVEIGAMVALGEDFEIIDGCLRVGRGCGDPDCLDCEATLPGRKNIA